MLKTITYGSTAEIHAASILYGHTIYVYQGDVLMDTYCPYAGCEREIYLLYNPRNEHYSCLKPADEFDLSISSIETESYDTIFEKSSSQSSSSSLSIVSQESGSANVGMSVASPSRESADAYSEDMFVDCTPDNVMSSISGHSSIEDRVPPESYGCLPIYSASKRPCDVQPLSGTFRLHLYSYDFVMCADDDDPLIIKISLRSASRLQTFCCIARPHNHKPLHVGQALL